MRCWWPLLTPTTLPPTFSSVLPDWAVHPLTQHLHCLHHRSSVLCWFLLAARCSQSGSHRKRAQVKGVLEISKPLNPRSANYQQWDPENYHKHYRSVSSSLIWEIRVVSQNYCLDSMSAYHTSGIKRSWQKPSGLWGSQSGCPQGGDRRAGLRQWLEGDTGKVLGPWQRYFLFSLGASSIVLSVWELSFAVC